MNDHLKNHLVNLYLIALSDGHFAPEELDTIVKIGEEKGFSKDDFQKAILEPDVKFHVPATFLGRIHLLYDFAKVILADGKIDPEERESFLRFCHKFGFEAEQSAELFAWLIDMAKQGISSQELEKEIIKQTEN